MVDAHYDPKQITPRLVALADAANRSMEGKLNLLGEFDVIWAQQVPCIWPSLTFVAKLRWPFANRGPETMQLRVVNDDEHLIAPIVEFSFESRSPKIKDSENGATLVLPFRMAAFPAYGCYHFVLVADGHEICRAPLFISRPQPAPQEG